MMEWGTRFFDLTNKRWVNAEHTRPLLDLPWYREGDAGRLSETQKAKLARMSKDHGFGLHAIVCDTGGMNELWAYPPMRSAPYIEGWSFPTLVAITPKDAVLFPYLSMVPVPTGSTLRYYRLLLARCGEQYVAAVQPTPDGIFLVVMDPTTGKYGVRGFEDTVSAVHVIDDGIYAAVGRRIIQIVPSWSTGR
jgi:hypothetical protein